MDKIKLKYLERKAQPLAPATKVLRVFEGKPGQGRCLPFCAAVGRRCPSLL